MPSILFQNQDTSFAIKQKNLLKKWIINTIHLNKATLGDLSFIFCTDDYLLDLNKKYLQHQTLTDIITFDYSFINHKNTKIISGDIFISVDRLKENAQKYKVTLDNELHRIMIHGVLHLCGFKDKTEADKQTMTKNENLCLLALDQLKNALIASKIKPSEHQ